MEGSGAAKSESMLPTVTGILLIITGLLGLVTGGQAALASGADFSIMGVPAEFIDMISGIVLVCGVIWIILSIIVLLGGIMAWQKKRWGVVILGSILGLFTIGYGLGSLLALIALILAIVSRKEYT
jgi:hypothetical protein